MCDFFKKYIFLKKTSCKMYAQLSFDSFRQNAQILQDFHNIQQQTHNVLFGLIPMFVEGLHF